MSNDEVVFDEVQIGRGLRPVAQHGRVVIGSDTVTLYGTGGKLIATGPISATNPGMMRFSRGNSVGLTVDGTKYNVSPGVGAHLGTVVLPGDLKHVKSGAAYLLGLLETRSRA